MRKQSRKDEDKQFILGILIGRSKDNAVGMEEMRDITCFSREKIKKIIYELVVKDEFPIALKTEFPYGFFMRTEKL